MRSFVKKGIFLGVRSSSKQEKILKMKKQSFLLASAIGQYACNHPEFNFIFQSRKSLRELSLLKL